LETEPDRPSAEDASPLRRWGVPAALVGLVIVFLWDGLFAGRTLLLRDVIFDGLPWRRFAADALADGHLPLWNPYSRFGQPFLANPQSAVLYPPHLVFNVLPAAFALQVTLALHLTIAALSTYALGRHWKLDRAPAALAAVTFAFGGYMTANLEFLSVLETLAWCPLTLLLASRLFERLERHEEGSRAWAALPTVLILAVVLALQILPGNPQPFGFTLLIAGAYVIGRGVRARAWDALGSALLGSAGALFLALGLCMVQLLPTWELLGNSVRAGRVDAGMDIASMHPRHLLTLLFPFMHGAPGADVWWGEPLFEFWLGSFHAGLPALVLASFAALLPRGDARRPLAAFLAAIAVIGLVLAFGDHTPVYPFLYENVPGFDRVRWPAKALQMVVVSLAFLAGIGLQTVLELRTRSDARAPRSLLVAWFFVSAGAVWVWLLSSGGPEVAAAVGDASFEPTPTRLAVVTSDCGRTVLFLVASLVMIGALLWRRIDARWSATAAVALAFLNLFALSRAIHGTGDADLLDLAPRDLGAYREAGTDARVFTNYSHAQYATYGSHDPTAFRNAVHAMAGESSLPHRVFKTYGGDALQVAETRDVTDLLEDQELPMAQADRLADLLGVRFALSGPPFEAFAPQPNAPGLRWIERGRPLPRAFCVDGVVLEEDRVQAMRRLLSPGFDPSGMCVLDPSTPAFNTQTIDPKPPTSARAPPGVVTDVRYGWNRVEVDVEAARECILVLTDTWFSGWEARAGDASLPVHRVNVVFRGVFVPRGRIIVTFEYRPLDFRIGLVLSSVTALLMLALGGVVFRRRRATGRSRGLPRAAS
jgi:hypothetical protein